jgi:hypothetical protein
MTAKHMTAGHALVALHTETGIVEWVLPRGTPVSAGSPIASVRVPGEDLAAPVYCDGTGVVAELLITAPQTVSKDDAIVIIEENGLDWGIEQISPEPMNNAGTNMQTETKFFLDVMRGLVAGLDSVPVSQVDDAYIARKQAEADAKEDAFAKERGLKKVELPVKFKLI